MAATSAGLSVPKDGRSRVVGAYREALVACGHAQGTNGVLSLTAHYRLRRIEEKSGVDVRHVPGVLQLLTAIRVVTASRRSVVQTTLAS